VLKGPTQTVDSSGSYSIRMRRVRRLEAYCDVTSMTSWSHGDVIDDTTNRRDVGTFL